MTALYLVSGERPDGFVTVSESNQWIRWLHRNIPETLHKEIKKRLKSNLKHLIAGLEMKAALIEPHRHRRGGYSVLFEPYFQNLILEFCVSAFSVLEGLGSAHWLARNSQDGSDGPRIFRNRWQEALCAVYDEAGEHGLNNAVEQTLAVRDMLHQDQLGLRENIDWHALSYDRAFTPARHALRIILRREADYVPETSNLHVEWDR